MQAKDLERADLATLARYNKETKKVDFQDASVLETPVSRDRLIAAGMAKKDGTLTEEGLKLAERACVLEEKLKEGVPFEKRTSADPRAMVEKGSTSNWYQATVTKKPLCTNGEIMFFGKPEKGTSPLKADARGFKKNITLMLKGEFKEVFPQTYQMASLSGPEWITLADSDGKAVVAVQAKYFDFIRSRFKAGRFFAKDEVSAVQVRVKNVGMRDDAIAFIMPGTGVIKRGKVQD